MKSDVGLSDLALANVEALANGETPPNVITCYSAYRQALKDPNVYEPIWEITSCNGCKAVQCFEYKDIGTCTKGGAIFV